MAIAERLLFDLGPNVELITATSLLAASFLGFPFAVLVPFFSIFISDVLLINTRIFLFTWSAYIIIGGGGLFLQRFKNQDGKLILASTFQSLGSSVFFFVWTNFGVWYQGWYPPTTRGLWTCYLMGIPFFKYNFLGNLIVVPILFSAVVFLRKFWVSRLASWAERRIRI